MRRTSPAIAAVLVAACVIPGAQRPPASEAPLPTARAVQLARVRCLVVAPLENASDEPLVAEAATGALVSAIDPNRTTVYPIDDLRGLFKGTPLELPEGVSASLALELGELVAADAVLYGAVEGRVRGPDSDVTLTLRLAASGVRDTLFWRSVRVLPREGEGIVEASRRAALAAAEPILERIGVPGRKVCFDQKRIDRVRLLAAAGEKPAPAPSRVTAPLPPAPPPVVPGASPPQPRLAGQRSSGDELPPPPPPPPASGATTAATPAAAAPAATAAVEPALEVELVGPGALAALRARREAAGREVAAVAPAPPRPARPALTPRQAAWAAKLAGGQRFVVDDVAFAGRAPRLERQGGLVDLAAALAATPKARIRIEGFVDATRSGRQDLKDSMELARAAGRRLFELGVPRDRVTWAGRGGDAPLAPNFSARGRAKNRRVEVVAQ